MKTRDRYIDELRKVDAALQAVKAVLSGSALLISEGPLLDRRREIILAMEAAQEVENDQQSTGADEQSEAIPPAPVVINLPTHLEFPAGVKAVSEPLPSQADHSQTVMNGSAAFSSYLHTLILEHQMMVLPGVRGPAGFIRVDIERFYISLSARDKTPSGTVMRPQLEHPDGGIDRSLVTLSTALRRYPRMILTGEAGSGKTTVLTYLFLTFARAGRGEIDLIRQRLQLDVENPFPVWIDLPDFAQYLHQHPEVENIDPSDQLIEYVQELWSGHDILFAKDFFVTPLVQGEAVLFFDGLSEIANPSLRARVDQIVAGLVRQYPLCRMIVCSRLVALQPPPPFSSDFGLVQLQRLTRMEIRRALHSWMDVIEVQLVEATTREVLARAEKCADEMIQLIEHDASLQNHLGNPLMLYLATVIFRQQGHLPTHRAGILWSAFHLLTQSPGKIGEVELEWEAETRRRILMFFALQFQTHRMREINAQHAHHLLDQFLRDQEDPSFHLQFDRFLAVEARYSGLWVEIRPGRFQFAHRLYQEFLAALALVEGMGEMQFTLNQVEDFWWREVFLLQADLYGADDPNRLHTYLRALVDMPVPQKYDRSQLLLLAAECLIEAGGQTTLSPLAADLQRKLQPLVDVPIAKDDLPALKRKLSAIHSQERLRQTPPTPRLWKLPWGEPEWARISAGSFWMGSESPQAQASERLLHRVDLGEFHISRIPITNQQFALYVADSGAPPPDHWVDRQPPRGREAHPVVYVSWHEAMAYCKWLSEKLRQFITLPSEAEWEKAARGDRDQREYPWGNTWENMHCNSVELELDDTIPSAFFNNDASPYHCLDMSGNIWEWTRSLVLSYPYHASQDREPMEGDQTRVLRGGAFDHPAHLVRCTCRNTSGPHNRARNIGFRVISASAIPSSQQKDDAKQSWQRSSSLLSRTRP